MSKLSSIKKREEGKGPRSMYRSHSSFQSIHRSDSDLRSDSDSGQLIIVYNCHVLESYPNCTVRYCAVCKLRYICRFKLKFVMQVQFYGMFYKTKGNLKKEGYKYRVPPYGRDETLGRVSNFLFSGFCALKSSLFWIMVGRYML